MPIHFNKPYFTGKEIGYLEKAIQQKHISGDGIFTQQCHQFFEKRYGFKKCLLTTSCTDALEMAAILTNIQEGDEVIVPAFTFASTANAFILRGAKIIFADSQENHPNICTKHLEKLITPKTKALVVLHYAGVACNMNDILNLCQTHNLYLIEDAAQAIDAYFENKPLGSLGHFSAFSFHETKNIIAGEGGMLVVNDDALVSRAEIVREKGTNRRAFLRGELNRYEWVDIGSSFSPSELIAAFLYAQLEDLEHIQTKRKTIWNNYQQLLQEGEQKGYYQLPQIPAFAQHNYHIFYLICKDLEQRNRLIQYLKSKGIQAVFHYVALHKSSFFRKYQPESAFDLPNSDKFSDTLLRLPFYVELKEDEQIFICDEITKFFKNQ